MNLWFPNLNKAAKYSGYALALFGAGTLLLRPVSWLYNRLSLSDAVGIARPFCERYVFPMPDSAHAETEDQWRLVGVTFYATRAAEAVRFQFSGLNAVLRWHVTTDNLSQPERKALLASLPSGVVREALVSSPLPTLPADAKVVVTAIALVSSDDDCGSPESVRVTSVSGKVYATNPHFAIFYRMDLPPLVITILLVLLVGLGVSVAVKRISKRKF